MQKWLQSRSKFEKFLLIFAILFTVALLCLTVMLVYKLNQGIIGDMCVSEKCVFSARQILEKLDTSVDPCDDFYQFTCGNFLKNAIIPEDRNTISSFSTISNKVHLQLKQIIQEPFSAQDSKSLMMTKQVYQSCLNITKTELEGLSFIRKAFKDLGGWPVLEGVNWRYKKFDWKKLLYSFRRHGWRRNVFLNVQIQHDLKNSSQKIIAITQPSLPYEFSHKTLNDKLVNASYNYLVNLAMLMGADEFQATTEMQEVIDFQKKLATIIVPFSKRSNMSSEYNPTTIRTLHKDYPSIPWFQLINVYLYPLEMLHFDSIVNIAMPTFIRGLEILLLGTNKRILANYMFSLILKDSVVHLPKAFRKEKMTFIKTLHGKSQLFPRWKECIFEVEKLHIAVSHLYVKNFFNENTRSGAILVAEDIKNSFLEAVDVADWMDLYTKVEAIAKVNAISSVIGYPNEILDEQQIDEYYEDLTINPENLFLAVTLNISLFTHKNEVKQLNEEVTRPDWKSHAYAFYVNALYHQQENTIEIPAAILQETFFDVNRPQYLNYGSIGEVIGHEITHGFDDFGKQYDQSGNLNDWWQPETMEIFLMKSQCLVEQYGNYTIPEIEMNLNGRKCLGENIADNGGIKIAYRGYLKWLERNGEEPSLPDLPYNPKQMFWLSAASNWCTKYRKEALKELVLMGHHAPHFHRVTISFMNSGYFAEDFQCPLGSTMNPIRKCSMW